MSVASVFAAHVHPKFRPEVIRAIYAAKREGKSLSEAAKAAGVHRDTIYDWLRRSKADETGLFTAFADGYRRAIADGHRLQFEAIERVLVDDAKR